MTPVKVDPPQITDSGPLVGPSGRQMFRLVPRPQWQGTFMDDVANNLNMWLQGDLSFLVGRMPMTGTPVRPDRDKRKRDAMADVLDGQSK